jgi:hypothetical protein
MDDKIKRTYRLPPENVKQVEALVKFINKNNPRAPKANRDYVVQEAINYFYDYLINFEKEIPA